MCRVAELPADVGEESQSEQPVVVLRNRGEAVGGERVELLASLLFASELGGNVRSNAAKHESVREMQSTEGAMCVRDDLRRHWLLEDREDVAARLPTEPTERLDIEVASKYRGEGEEAIGLFRERGQAAPNHGSDAVGDGWLG